MTRTHSGTGTPQPGRDIDTPVLPQMPCWRTSTAGLDLAPHVGTQEVPLLLLASLLALPAQALDVQRLVLPWTELSLQAEAPDAAARGPELLSAGPGGLLAVCDPVTREVALFDDASLSIGQLRLSFPVRLCSDIEFTDSGDLLVLDHAGRRLSLVAADGTALAETTLPALVPTGVRVGVQDDLVVGIDIFGNHHPIATVVVGGLQAPRDSALDERAGAVVWDATTRTMRTDDLTVDLPQALVASGQRVGHWLVIDAVVGDSPSLVVQRQAWHLPTGQVAQLPVTGRSYAPRGDAAQDTAGRLVVLDPREDGLGLLQVTP